MSEKVAATDLIEGSDGPDRRRRSVRDPGNRELDEDSPATTIISAAQTSHIFRCKTRLSEDLQISYLLSKEGKIVYP
jgi:hypothetical protein